MIKNKKELRFYISADRLMNGYPLKCSIKELVHRLFLGGGIVDYLKAMRCYSYYKGQDDPISIILRHFHGTQFRKLGKKLSFSIGEDVFGYGLLIPHYGTIVVGSTNRIGNYAVLHTSTCISSKSSEIGDGLYLSTGAKITQKVILGNGVMVGANSVVNKSCESNSLIVGAPAKPIGERAIWYSEEPVFQSRVNQVEQLKKALHTS